MTAQRRTLSRSDLTAQMLQEAFALDGDGGLIWLVQRGRCAAGSKVSAKAGHVCFRGLFVKLYDVAFAVANSRLPQAPLLFVNGNADDLRAENMMEVPAEPQAMHFRVALRYDAADGHVYRVDGGERFGFDRGDGYLVGSVFGRQMLVHRVVWMLLHGTWPEGVIDHIDGNPSNNRIENLRDVPQAINCQNRHDPRGYRVVTRNGTTRFPVSVGVGGKSHYIGNYDDEAKARSAYVKAKRRLHPGNTL